MKVWIFEETGEVRIGKEGEYFTFKDAFLNEKPYCILQSLKGNTLSEVKILKLTEYPSNPLTPIVRFAERWKNFDWRFKQLGPIGEDIWQAISKTMAILEAAKED